MTVRTSYSSLTRHRECPQAWSYGRLARLESADESASIGRDFGTWGHAWLAIEGMRRGVRTATLRHAPESVQLGNGEELPVTGHIVSDLNRLEKDMWTRFTQWWQVLSDETAEVWVDYLGESAPKRLVNIVRGYRTAWKEADLNRHVLGVEVPWERELPSGVVLQGVVDLVEVDLRRNVVVVTDHKFKKRTEQSVEEDLLDSQLQFYAWGASPVVERWGFGPIKAVAYDRIRSTAGKLPTLTASGSLSKSVTDFDLDTYLRWAAGPDGEGVPWGTEGEFVKTGKNAGKPKFGKYTAEAEVVARLSTETARSIWFDRTFTPLSTNVVRTHLLSADATARTVPATVERWESEGDAARNFTFGCKFCDFRRLCAAQLVGGPDGDYPPEDFGLRTRPKRS